MSVALVVSALAVGLYDCKKPKDLAPLFLKVGIAMFAAWSLVAFANIMLTFSPIGRRIIVVSFVTAWLAGSGIRVLFFRLMSGASRNVLLVGPASSVRLIEREASRNGTAPINIVAVVEPDCLEPANSGEVCLRAADLREIIKTNDVETVIVSEGCHPHALDQVVACMENGLKVESLAGFLEDNYQKVPVEMIDPKWIISSRMRLSQPLATAVKRGGDLVLAAVGAGADSAALAVHSSVDQGHLTRTGFLQANQGGQTQQALLHSQISHHVYRRGMPWKSSLGLRE